MPRPAPSPPYVPDLRLRGPLRPLLHPDLVEALGSPEPTAVLRALAPGLFTLPVFAPESRAALLAELEALEAEAALGRRDLDPPNSMNEHGVQLAQVGLGGLADALCAEVVQPLSAAFPDLGPVALGDAHGFSVSYGRGRDTALGFHVDDSTLTLNLCLGEDFSGADVVFEGVRCIHHRQSGCRPDERIAWSPQPGEALLHLGPHRHLTRPIRTGRRTNLVIWCRDGARVDLDGCGPWCGDALPGRSDREPR